MQIHLPLNPLRACQDADNLPVNLKAVEEVGKVGELEGRGILAVDVQPDEAIRTNCATEDLGEVDQVDIGKASANEREGRIEVGGAEGDSRVARG